MNSKKIQEAYPKDEISLKELIDKGAPYLNDFKRFWKLILIFTLLASAVSAFYFSSRPPLYEARLSFMLNEDEGGQFSGMNSILGQFGFPMVEQRVNISKVLELSMSRKIIRDAIFQMVEIGGKETYLANHLINVYNLNDKWSKSEQEMNDFEFTHSRFDEFKQNENFALRHLCVMVGGTPANRKQALLETDFGKNTTIMSFVVKSDEELISYHLTKALFDATSRFYIDKSTEKQKGTMGVLVTKRDSLRKVYDQLEYRYADMVDKSSGMFSMKTDIKKERTRAEMIQLGSSLSKLEENLALVEFGIENSTPILQVIDNPILPLIEVKSNPITVFIISLIFFLFITIFFLLTYRIYRITIT